MCDWHNIIRIAFNYVFMQVNLDEGGSNTAADIAWVMWDKKFMFATRCVLSCPVALKNWRKLARKLDMEDVAKTAAEAEHEHYPHDPCQKVLEMWYELKTDKSQAIRQLQTAVSEIGAKNAHGKSCIIYNIV